MVQYIKNLKQVNINCLHEEYRSLRAKIEWTAKFRPAIYCAVEKMALMTVLVFIE